MTTMTTGNTIAIAGYVRTFAFVELFHALGWDNFAFNDDALKNRGVQHVCDVDGTGYTLSSLSEKRGLQVFRCAPAPDGGVPPLSTRRRISRKLLAFAREHLIIYVDATRHMQKWEWNIYEKGKPQTPYGHTYLRGTDATALVQKLERLTVTLDEDDRISIVDVSGRVSQAFKATDTITKKFYDQYEKQYAQFVKDIVGIADETDRGQYATLMLDRLMFVYFLQSKGFLDDKRDYLRVKFDAMRDVHGPGHFFDFYRRFLLRLFHEALATKEAARADGLDALLGDVPYLNGGLFEQHRIETSNRAIHIPDEAFDTILTFFDAWTWHLDGRSRNTQVTRAAKETKGAKGAINPDVLGYIFEKFINQKQMGAYYTKEDITEYIGKNTIIPWLFDAVKEADGVPFAPGGEVWAHLREQPDRYLYDAVRYGVVDNGGAVIPLPDEIAAGVTDMARRGGWNRPAPQPYALPTETWREHMARRERCLALRGRLGRGEITTINDCITENLNIRQFAEDVIAETESPDVLHAFYDALNRVTVLDPTCGSGAFLFAALNILAPLYQACITGMERWTEERPGGRAAQRFAPMLAEIAAHPNTPYFITKRIIVQNLYGVDLMPDATEICKLRLFLTLAAELRDDDRGRIEPLPDIEVNIRAGNTLVGFTSGADVERASGAGGQGKFDLFGDAARIANRAKVAALNMQKYRDVQSDHTGLGLAQSKQGLRDEQRALADELDRFLAAEYGIVEREMLPLEYAARFAQWQASH